MNHSGKKKMIRTLALMMALCLMYTSTPALATGVDQSAVVDLSEISAEISGEITETEAAPEETQETIVDTDPYEETSEQVTEDTSPWIIEETTKAKKEKKKKNKNILEEIESSEFVEEETTEFVEEESTEVLESEFNTNEELIADQTIVVPEPVEENEFRFTWDQDAEQAIILPNSNVYEEPFVEPARRKDRKNWEAPRIVGTALTGSQVYILESNIYLEGSDIQWYYIESGTVRGFVREADLLMDEDEIEKFLLEEYGDQLTDYLDRQEEARIAEIVAQGEIPEEALTTETWDDSMILCEVDEEEETTTEEETTAQAKKKKKTETEEEEVSLLEACSSWMVDVYPTVTPMHNEAIDYSLSTGYDPVVKKDYAIARKEVPVYGQKNIFDPNAQVIGYLPAEAVAYVLNDDGGLVYYIESGDVRGFVAAKNLYRGKRAKQMLKEIPAKNREKGVTTVDPQDNPALYYTIKSVYKATEYSALRNAMIQFALQFVGNPYVWGGEDLVNGADCSGFVRQIYKTYGINLPRTSREQSKVGMQIPVEDALPGDLIFYAKNGTVYHVTMYMGDGRVVQAANRNAGIITSSIGNNAVWACRILQD